MSRWLFALIVLGGCSNEVAGGKADGAAVFAEACARCHGGGGKPSESMVAQLKVRDLTSAEFVADARSAVLYLKPWSVVVPEYVWAETDRWIDFPWSTATAPST